MTQLSHPRQTIGTNSQTRAAQPDADVATATRQPGEANGAHTGETPLIHVSGLRFPEPVGKGIYRLADGSLDRQKLLKPRAGPSAVINEEFASASEAFDFRLAADCKTMLFTGTYAAGVRSGALALHQGALANARRFFEETGEFDIVGFTKEYLAFRPGAGLLPVDIDPKNLGKGVAMLWPEQPTRLMSVDEVSVAIETILPEAHDAPIQIVPSSSSMIIDAMTREVVIGPGGWRVLIPIDDATQIPRVLETMHLRCWARGEYRYAYLNEHGTFYPRSLADVNLGRPTQPDYVMPDLSADLAKDIDAMESFAVDGPFLTAAAVVISDEDRALAEKNIEAARAILKPAATKLCARAVRKHAGTLETKGVPKQAALRAAEKRFADGATGLLAGSDFIQLADGDGGEIAASVLLTPEGEQYDGRICYDPVEPDYDGGRPTGMIYWNGGFTPGINSFAHGKKFWRIRHDVETVTAAIDDAMATADSITLALAQAELEPVERVQKLTRAAKALGLGNERQSLKDGIERQQQRIKDYAKEHVTTDATEERGGAMPLDTPLPLESFPRTRRTKDGIKVIDHVDNVAHMLDSYGLGYRYNTILKQIDWKHPGLLPGGDNADMALQSRMVSLCALNAVPDKHLTMHLVGLADQNATNPVVEHLVSLSPKWDSRPRFGALVAAMQPEDPQIAEIVLRLFLIQACAAADNARLARAMDADTVAAFEGCLVLAGGQGIYKTKGVRKLLPPALRQYFKEALTLNTRDKDSKTAAVTTWVVELGELEATFKKTDINDIKNFLSQTVDEIRAPFAPKASKFGRRSVYFGTVNDFWFLVDETGNRRFWPLTVGTLRIGWSDDEIIQLWAEAWSRYAGGEMWWPTAEEEELLAANAERYRLRTGLEEVIEDTFAWGAKPDEGRWTAQQVYALVQHSAGVGALTPLASKTIGATLSRLWKQSGLVTEVNGVAMIEKEEGVWVKINATGGKNRGWLLPPTPLAAAVEDETDPLHGSRPGGDEDGSADDGDGVGIATKKLN